MAGLGKYHMGGYGRIGVYRVKFILIDQLNLSKLPTLKTYFFKHALSLFPKLGA